MRTGMAKLFSIFVGTCCAIALVTGCNGKVNFLDKGAGVLLKIEEVTPGDDDGLTPDEYKALPIDPATGLHPMFGGVPGLEVPGQIMASVISDLSGYNAVTDPDGDGIPSDEELGAQFTNPYVADCPRITARIDTPVQIDLVVNENDQTQNHSELITDSDVKNTINNSMESRQYSQLNLKTTPYVTKNSLAWSDKNAGSMGYSLSMSLESSLKVPSVDINSKFNTNMSTNMSFDKEQSRSTMSEKTVFQNVNYIDNLNRSGSEYKDDTVERISKNFRQSGVSKSDFTIDPNAGKVSASLYLINESRNMPVRIINVKLTLSFRTPSGNCLSVKTFFLRYDDYTDFDEEVYGGQELGPYAINITGLNTNMVKKALANGYTPQIHVVSYDMRRVENSNYNPGVENLKIVEETAKSRTAVIKIIGAGVREMYRVPAFEVDANGTVVPGISLKKALFKIYKSQIGGGEGWDVDKNGDTLTVSDSGLKWKTGFVEDPDRPGEYKYSDNVKGNVWSLFSTCVKSYVVSERVAVTDGSGQVIGSEIKNIDKRIETVESIGNLKKYNPFSAEDNPSYNEKEPLTTEEFLKMKYWVILHNGRYFNGDINDPIWAGERYEIIFFDAKDFNERFRTVAYAPLMDSIGSNASSESGSEGDFVDFSQVQSDYDFKLNTLWNNELDGRSMFARSVYLGRVVRGDVIRLDIGMDEFRSLFDIEKPGKEFNQFSSMDNVGGKIWNRFNYTFDDGKPVPTGMPGNFDYEIFGGSNSIILRINKAENARHYTVTFWRPGAGETEAQGRVVKIELQDLDENYGYYVVSRISSTVADTPVGAIDEGTYYVRVRAHGYAYNVPVTRLGTLSANGAAISQATTATVSVEAPGDTDLPGSFTANSTGLVNSLLVTINQSADAEYYKVVVEGPLNYGWGNGEIQGVSFTPREFYAHTGSNLLEVSKSDPGTIGHETLLTDDEKNWAAPGVYRVYVYGVNKNCLNPDGTPNPDIIVPAQGDEYQTVFVDFDRYDQQKKYFPKTQFEKFVPQNVDLEVNFNDGSGWFALKLDSLDNADADRIIDCRYTTSFQQNRGLVTIYFTAPTGSGGLQNNQYNVFRGGAEMVDVYLRTRPLQQYRDTLWPKSSIVDYFTEGGPSGYRSININSPINSLPGYDPLMYWTGNIETDATTIENYDLLNNGPRLFTSPFNLSGNVAAGDFGVVAPAGKEDFFFSPWRKLTYRIAVSLADVDLENMVNEVTHVDNPRFRPIGGYQNIKLNWLESQYAEKYDINWFQVSNPANQGNSNDVLATPSNGCVQIENLIPNTNYQVTITAKNSISASTPVSYIVKTMPEKQAFTLTDPGYSYYGFYQFKDPAVPITNNNGNILMNGVDFQYEQPLNAYPYNIWNTGTSGDLTSGYIRLVNNGLNITDSGGLNLTPVAKSIGDIGVSPPNGQCWIDPISGKFVMPRPDYWSKLESVDSIENPIIMEQLPTYSVTLNGTPDTGYTLLLKTGKFNACVEFDGAGSTPRVMNFYPFGNSSTTLNCGTISLWYSFIGNGTRLIKIYLGSNCYIYLAYNHYAIYYNDAVVDQASYASLVHPVFRHIYVSWKNDSNGLSDGTTIKAYTNGGLPLTMTAQWNTVPLIIKLESASPTYIDNLKIWKNIVSESPDWEYNSGAGREDALHPVYGDASGYKPNLSSPNGGVGFFCVPQ